MTKSKTIQVRVQETINEQLKALASRDDVSIAHVVRQAIKAYLAENNAPQCPACGSTDLGAPQDRFDAGHLVVAERKCADCGAIWEVD